MMHTLPLNATQPINTMMPINREIYDKNIVGARPGNTNSQTGIFIRSGIGAHLPFVEPNDLATLRLISRSAAMTGSADSAASSILPTIGQPTKLVNFPRRSKYLIAPEQYIAGAHTLPPKPVKENNLGPEYIHTWSHDQNDIGFDGIKNPNPVNGLPPLDPVEVQDTIQPNITLINRRKWQDSIRPRNKINAAHGYRINKPMNRRMINVQNAVNDAIWGRKY